MTYIIRIYSRSLHDKKINTEEKIKSMFEGFKLKPIKMAYSQFGECYFIEVEGNVDDKNDIYAISETKPKDFDWAV